jgi:pimeloyl-ACP methyl ester carboxylesterase
MTASLLSSAQALRSWYLGFFQLPLLPDVLVARRLDRLLRQSGLPPDAVERYCRTLTEPGAMSGALGWYRGVPFSVGAPVGPVDVPTTYVWGRQDAALGRVAAEGTRRHVTGAYRFVELDAGHWLPERHPQEVADAVLDRVGADRG